MDEHICEAIIAIGSGDIAIADVSAAVLIRLRKLDLIRWNNGERELTSAGKNLLRLLKDGGSFELVSAFMLSPPHGKLFHQPSCQSSKAAV